MDTTTEKNDYVGEWTEDLHDLTDDPNCKEETIHIERKKQWNPLNFREYSYGDMMDLQSRLMLVSGKTDSGRESIERFTAVSYMFNNCKCFLSYIISYFFPFTAFSYLLLKTVSIL